MAPNTDQQSLPTSPAEPKQRRGRDSVNLNHREGTMPANRFNGFTDYGVGIGLRIPHYRHILDKKPVVDWFEIISENYMVGAGPPADGARRHP